MNLFWIEATVLEVNSTFFMAKTKIHDCVLFHTDKDYHLNVNDNIQVLCDEAMTLSIPPQQRAYDVKRRDNDEI